MPILNHVLKQGLVEFLHLDSGVSCLKMHKALTELVNRSTVWPVLVLASVRFFVKSGIGGMLQKLYCLLFHPHVIHVCCLLYPTQYIKVCVVLSGSDTSEAVVFMNKN